MVVDLLLFGTRKNTPGNTRNFCALPFIFVIVNIGADFLLVLNLVALTVNGMPMKHPQNYIHLQKVNCLCFIFLILSLFFECVCVDVRFRFRFGYFIFGMRVLHTFSDLYSFASFFFLLILHTPKTLFTIPPAI